MPGGCSTLPSGTDYYIKLWLNSQLAVLLFRRRRMKNLTSEEIDYVLNGLIQDKKNIDDVLLFFEMIIPNFSLKELKEKAEVPKDKEAFSWICYALSFLGETSENLDKLVNLYQNKR